MYDNMPKLDYLFLYTRYKISEDCPALVQSLFEE